MQAGAAKLGALSLSLPSFVPLENNRRALFWQRHRSRQEVLLQLPGTHPRAPACSVTRKGDTQNRVGVMSRYSD